MPIKRVRSFLEDKNVLYSVINHSTAYTSLEVAELTHISGQEIAKTVMVKMNGDMAMVVLPASCSIDLKRLSEATDARYVELAKEDDFMYLFPDCEIGAMPPFGNLYNVDVYIDPTLEEDKYIAFNAGNHRELVQMLFEDFDRIVRPKRLKFSCRLVAA